jgi:death on curing protein
MKPAPYDFDPLLISFAGDGEPDAAALAATYVFGIARNHPIVDGNKRIAIVASETFLVLNGYSVEATDAEVIVAFFALAADDASEGELADWFWTRLTDSV